MIYGAGTAYMTTGKVIGIYIAQNRGDQTVLVDQVNVIPGLGIEGDRYSKKPSNSDGNTKPGREITLIEMEAIESMRDMDGLQITPDQTRRNIVTRGIALNDLVGQLFYIGNIQLRGVRLCEPCQYLANQTDPRILSAMVHRGGLRADIVTEGIIHINDIISTSE
jgi:MOSC domain-containing protein YiiM